MQWRQVATSIYDKAIQLIGQVHFLEQRMVEAQTYAGLPSNMCAALVDNVPDLTANAWRSQLRLEVMAPIKNAIQQLEEKEGSTGKCSQRKW